MTSITQSTVWVWRSGREEERDEWAIEHSFAGGGWDWLPSMVDMQTRDELRQLYQASRPENAAQGEPQHVGQLANIRFDVAVGDVVIMPRTHKGQLAFGIVTAPYSYREFEPDPTRRHVAQVDWVRPDFPREQLSADLSNILNRRGTIFRPRAVNAQERLRALIETGHDPGYSQLNGGDAGERAFLLTWNPDLVGPESDWHTSGRWLSRSKKPRLGDRVYLLRQRNDRGIARSGVVVEEAFLAPHWDPEKTATSEETTYLGIRWETDLLLPPPLPIDLLKGQIPDYAWNHQYSSGNQLPPKIADQVADLWSSTLIQVPSKHFTWDIQPGTVVTSAEIGEQFGRALYVGIQPSARTPNVFVYADSEASVDINLYDGWSEDETVFLYTGEGRQGDQQLTKGNKAILQHQSEGRSLRVFAADGRLGEANTRTHLYLGAFEVDAGLPYVRQTAPDDDGEERSVVVFRLRPIGVAERRKSERSPIGDVAPMAQSQLVNVEEHGGGGYIIQPAPTTTGTRRESELVGRFIKQHPSGEDAFRRYRLRPKGELSYLYTDVYDTKTSTLYEAKGHTTRNSVREAIGQILDYRRHIDPPPQALAILLPSRPTHDLLQLIMSLGMLCVAETASGAFEQLTPN